MQITGRGTARAVETPVAEPRAAGPGDDVSLQAADRQLESEIRRLIVEEGTPFSKEIRISLGDHLTSATDRAALSNRLVATLTAPESQRGCGLRVADAHWDGDTLCVTLAEPAEQATRSSAVAARPTRSGDVRSAACVVRAYEAGRMRLLDPSTLLVNPGDGTFPTELLIDGTRYTRVEGGSASAAESLPDDVRAQLFLDAAYATLAARLGVDMTSARCIVIEQAGLKLAYRGSPPAEGEQIHTWNSPTEEMKTLRARAVALGLILGDDNIHNNHEIHQHEGSVSLRSVRGRTTYAAMRAPSHESLAAEAWAPPTLRVLKRDLLRLDLDTMLADLRTALDVPADLIEAMKERHRRLLHRLEYEMDGSYDGSAALSRDVEVTRAQRAREFDPAIVRRIADLIATRFRADFAKHTDFESFEAYKARVEAIPAYKEIIDEIRNDTRVVLVRSSGRRTSILREGFKNVKETGTSAFSVDDGYVEVRNEVEAASLGLDAESYLAQIPSHYHAKSAFLESSRDLPVRTGNDMYGSDYYVLSFEKLSKYADEGKVSVSLTLADSVRGSRSWLGRAVPLEDFPYFAAPFIAQYRRESGSKDKTFSTIDYRQGVHGLSDYLPDFEQGLHEHFNIAPRTRARMMDEMVGPSADYVEVQLHGLADIGLCGQIDVQSDAAPSDTLRQAFADQGVAVSTYP